MRLVIDKAEFRVESQPNGAKVVHIIDHEAKIEVIVALPPGPARTIGAALSTGIAVPDQHTSAPDITH